MHRVTPENGPDDERHPMTSIKRAVKRFAGSLVSRLAVLPPERNTRLILAYHRVLPRRPEGMYDAAMYVTAATLDMHIRELSRHFKIVPLATLLRHEEGTRVCSITFDDGWRDNYLHALPVVRRHGISATVFIPANMIGPGRRFWFEDIWKVASKAAGHGLDVQFMKAFDAVLPMKGRRDTGRKAVSDLIARLKEVRSDRLGGMLAECYRTVGLEPDARSDTVDLAEMEEMGMGGFEFGAHGLNHLILPALPSALKKREIEEAQLALRGLGVPFANFFCYPNGDYDDETLHYVKEAKYEGGLTTVLGGNGLGADPFLLRRIGVHEDIANSPSLFWFRIMQATIGRGR